MSTGCNNKTKQTFSDSDDLSIKKIFINESDIKKEEIGDFLVLDSYIILSSEELFGNVRRIIMNNDYIYIMDDQQKIFCYNMNGNLVFKIDRRGQGPQDYVHMMDFGIDEVAGKLFVYDDFARKIAVFSSFTGSYISNFSTQYMLPTDIGIVDGIFFFNKDHDFRVIDKNKQRYYLFYSETGKHIDRCFLPHDVVAEYRFSGGDSHPFFYNENQLLYNKMFDSRVYCLTKNQIIPLYDIVLPDQLPIKKIEEKMAHIEVVRSNYSYGLNNIFISGKIIHFIFSKGGYTQSCFYDLDLDKILFCGPRVLAESKKNLPFYSLIQGVLNGKFFALVSPDEINRRKETHPEYFSKDLTNITFDDNHIIAFYKIK
jgi:hypothetical protein